MIYDVNSPLFRSFLSQKGGGGSSDKRKQEEQKPKDQKPKASENKPDVSGLSNGNLNMFALLLYLGLQLNLNMQMEDGVRSLPSASVAYFNQVSSICNLNFI
ncbi:Wound-induced basic protein-like protein [Drosera capensis]